MGDLAGMQQELLGWWIKDLKCVGAKGARFGQILRGVIAWLRQNNEYFGSYLALQF